MNRYKKFYMDILGIKYKRVTECGEYERHANLCSTVALTKVTGLSFNDVYELQSKMGKEKHVLFNSAKHVIIPILKEYGYTKLKIPQRTTVGEFMYNHKEGKYIIFADKHVEYYMNGSRYIAPINSDVIMDLDSWLFDRVMIVYHK